MTSFNRKIAGLIGSTGDVKSTGLSNITSGDVVYYSSLDSLPVSGLTKGDAAFVESTKRLFVSNGSGWYNLDFEASAAPTWDNEPSAEYEITDSATPLTIIAKPADSDNPTLLNQSFASDSAQYMSTISNDSSVWTFTPKTKSEIATAVAAGNLTDSNGDFIYTFKWSDGISIISKAVTIAYNPGAPGVGFSSSPTEQNGGITVGSFTSSVTGQTFYYSNQVVNPDNALGTRAYFDTEPGGKFYLAMIGAGGGSGYSSSNRANYGGNGGVGMVEVTVPPGVTQMSLYAGGGGKGASSGDDGFYGGGDPGSSGSYHFSVGGGGYTALFSGINNTFSDLVAIVGGGGGGGNSTNFKGGHGGGINQGGTNGTGSPTLDYGGGGNVNSGGHAAYESHSYSSSNATAGSQLQGGDGSDSQYDGGSGGGGGRYGGGGGGGGYYRTGGPGGGGSGWADANYVTLLQYNGSDATQTGANWNQYTLMNYVRQQSGATDFTSGPIGKYGQGSQATNPTSYPTPASPGNTGLNPRAGHGMWIIWTD